MLSNHVSFVEHEGQNERLGLQTLSPSRGTRWIATLAKLPTERPRNDATNHPIQPSARVCMPAIL
jgi:hypothetical protein